MYKWDTRKNIKRRLYNKKQRADFLAENWFFETLDFVWTTSRGRDTYGYHICTLRDKLNNKVSSTCGGGYDMKGTCLGEFINKIFAKELRRLTANSGSSDGGFYGLSHYNNKTGKYQKRASKHTNSYVDGGCGFSSMEDILNKIGFKLSWVIESKNRTIYSLKTI
jgi:hypothetical protein